MKVVAVVACHGRLPLLKQTIQRLLNKNKVSAVVCVGSQEERNTCTDAGAMFIMHENKPLGKKWNAGFVAARELMPDALLFVGSSDWLSDNWLDESLPYLGEYDMIGKPDFYMLDIGTSLRSCWWSGYGKGERQYEPIGIGRIVSAKIMDSFDWKPFYEGANHSLDWQMYLKVRDNGGKMKLITGDHIKSLSISTNRWDNLHKFEDHWLNKVPAFSKRLETDWLDKEFPEHKIIF